MDKYLYDPDEITVSSSNTLITNEDHFSRTNASIASKKSILKPRRPIESKKLEGKSDRDFS
jgi:hypothetical protein